MTTEILDTRIPTTVPLGVEFQNPFERHYVSERVTSGRFWLALEEKCEWTSCDDDSVTEQVVVAHFSTPLKIFFGDENKNTIDWAYDLQDIEVKYTPTDEQIKEASTPIDINENGFADFELTDSVRAEIKKALESCIDENIMGMEEPFLEKMGGKL